MFGKNSSSSSSSSSNVQVNLTLDLANATFSGTTTFNSDVINNSTLTQIGDATFEDITINGSLVTDNITADVTGDVTGKLIPATNGSISGKNDYDIVYDVNGPNINSFTSHYFNCNANLILAINEYSVNSTKPFYCTDKVYSTGITNNTSAITNNSTLTQVGAATFTGATTFTGAVTTSGGFASDSGLTTHYSLGGHNYHDTTAITSPKVNNGIASGTQDGATLSTFNNAINSWFGTGFVDTCNKECKAVVNHRTGEFITNGGVLSNGTIYCPIISGTNGLEHTTTTTTGIHNFKIAGVQKVYINNTDLTNTVNLTQIGTASFTGAITAHGGITNNSTLTQVGNSTFTNTITANGGISLGDTNTDSVTIIKNIVSTNISELALSCGNEGTTTSTISLPIPEENSTRDYVTIRSTNAGVHHAYSTSGNYYYGNSIVPSYASLPTLTTLQIGGSASVSFTSPFIYETGYNYVTQSLPKGFYIVQGYMDFSGGDTNQELEFGLSTQTTSITAQYYQKTTLLNVNRDYKEFNYYISHATNTNYNFIFKSSSSILMYKAKCTFIRIA